MVLEIKQRHRLKSKDIKKLIRDLKAAMPASLVDEILSTKDRIEWIKLDQNEELYAVNETLTFWLKDGQYIPVLSYLLKNDLPWKSVLVDSGAIPFVSKGADVMRPGILEIDPTLAVDDIVVIRDSVHKRPLAVGKAKFSATEMQEMDKGKVIASLHSIVDNVWEFSKTSNKNFK